jgi:hypothetical protein
MSTKSWAISRKNRRFSPGRFAIGGTAISPHSRTPAHSARAGGKRV